MVTRTRTPLHKTKEQECILQRETANEEVKIYADSKFHCNNKLPFAGATQDLARYLKKRQTCGENSNRSCFRIGPQKIRKRDLGDRCTVGARFPLFFGHFGREQVGVKVVIPKALFQVYCYKSVTRSAFWTLRRNAGNTGKGIRTPLCESFAVVTQADECEASGGNQRDKGSHGHAAKEWPVDKGKTVDARIEHH